MRNLKRALSLALASVMLLGMMVVGTSAAFPDADDIQNKEAATVTSALGIFSGYGDGSFGPDKAVNRAEMATLIVKMLKGADFNADSYKAITLFTDIPAEMDWAKGYINYAAQAGVLAGYPDGTFKPEQTVNTAEAITFIINALKVDAGEGTWPNTVMTKAVEMGLFADLSLETEAPLTRDNLAVLLVEGILYNATGKTQYAITVKDDHKANFASENEVKEIEAQVFDSAISAKIYVNSLIENKIIQIATPAEGTHYTIAPIAVKNTLNEMFKLARQDAENGGKDVYGRPATVYTVDTKLVADFEVDPFVSADPVATIAGKATADQVKEALSGYKFSSKTSDKATVKESGTIWYVDSNTATGYSSNETVIDTYISNATTNNTVFEFYADSAKKITKIVEIKTYAAEVKKAATATTVNGVDVAAGKLYFAADNIATKIITDAAEGDVVLYTVANREVQTYEKADSFTGKLTSYNNAETSFEISGADYVISDAAVSGFKASDITKQITKDYVYFVDAYGDLIFATGVATEEEEEDEIVIPTDYAIYLDSVVAITPEESLWKDETTYYVEAQVKVMLTDGSIKIYDLPVTEKNGKYTVTFNNTATGEAAKATTVTLLDTTATNFEFKTSMIEDAQKDLDGKLKKGTIYTYTVAGADITLVSALAAFTGAEGKDDPKVTVFTSTEKITTAKPVVGTAKTGSGNDEKTHTVLANDKTVFIVKKAADKDELIVKTGLAALEQTEIPTGSQAIVNVTYNKNGNTNVAAVVFAIETPFKATPEAGPEVEGTVYVDGTYIVKVVSKKNTAVYTGYKADGTTVTLSETITDGYTAKKGVYSYNDDGTFKSAINTEEVTVGTVAGSTYELGAGNFVTVNDDTKIIAVASGATEADLVSGAKVVFDVKDGVATVIFITAKKA